MSSKIPNATAQAALQPFSCALGSLPATSTHAARTHTAPLTAPLTASRAASLRGLLRVLCLLMLGASLTGCGMILGGGSDGSPAPSAQSALAVTPVDLPAGVTAAQLAWAPSGGPVDGYLVFVSRNDGGFDFSHMVPTAAAQVSGTPGDSIRITVMAVTENGDFSESSPPSPPINFHPPVAAAQVAQSWAGGGAASATTGDTNGGPSATSSEAVDDTLAARQDGSDDDGVDADASADDTDETAQRLARAVREMLLNSDARLPDDGLSDAASRWLQDRVDREIAAGVALAGTGRRDDDSVRELVWQDQAGQLFVSDGQSALDSDDLPSTFEEAVRLHATERFRGLADFDGDGLGDWLIEDTITGEIWMIEGASDRIHAAADESVRADARLAGHGDFDGDGLSELVWIGPDRQLTLSRPGQGDSAAPMLDGSARSPEGFELLGIDDLDGDGRDDLLGRTADGRIAFARTRPSRTADASGTLEWQAGPPDSANGLDLVATLDLDHDGAAEIAWLDGDTLQIWDARRGPE